MFYVRLLPVEFIKPWILNMVNKIIQVKAVKGAPS